MAALRLWVTAREIADAQISGFPASEVGVNELAKREGWRLTDKARKRKGRGGGWEYHVDLLPKEAGDILNRPSEAEAFAEALRMEIEGHTAAGRSKEQARAVVARSHRMTEAELAAALAPPRAPVKPVMLVRETKAADREARPLPPVWAMAFLSHYALPHKPTISIIYEKMTAEEWGGPKPSLRSVQRWIEKMPALEKSRGRMGPREMRSLRVSLARDISELLPGDVYIADGHRMDVQALHRLTGKPFQPEFIAVMDVATRRCVGWSIMLGESAWAMADAYRAAFGVCVPVVAYADNGSSYKDDHLKQEVLGVFARGGVNVASSLPYGSQARRMIERFNATCWERADQVSQSSQSPVMEWPAFMQWCGSMVATYNAKPNSALSVIRDTASEETRPMSPDEAWAGAVAKGFKPVLLEADTAADLFRPYELRQANRGMVRIGGASYFSGDLEHYHKESVRVGYDIHDPGKVWVRDLDGRLIAIAERDGNKTPYMPLATIEKARESRALAQENRKRLETEERQIMQRLSAAFEPEAEFIARAQARMKAQATQAAAGPELSLPKEPLEKLAFWRGLAARAQNGLGLTDAETEFLRLYELSAEFRAALILERMQAGHGVHDKNS